MSQLPQIGRRVRQGLGRGKSSTLANSDSGLGQSANSTTNTPSFRNVSSESTVSENVTDDDFSFSDLCSAAEDVFETKQRDKLTFLNSNCLFFEKLDGAEFEVHSYEVQFPEHFTTLDKNLIFMKSELKQVLGKPEEVLFCPPNIVFLKTELPNEKTQVRTTLHKVQASLTLTHLPRPVTLNSFFETLLYRVAVLITRADFILPFALMSDQQRFDFSPGRVKDVVDNQDIMVRCDVSPITSRGTVEDLLNEMLYIGIFHGIDQRAMHNSLAQCLRELVVLNMADKNDYVIKDVLWDEAAGRNMATGAMISARKLNSGMIRWISPDKLIVRDSRRTAGTHQGVTYAGDRVTSFVGDLVTGQQRQLALLNFSESCKNDQIAHLLQTWNLALKDTAVLANGILLETEALVMQGGLTLPSVKGWTDRLAGTKVLSPIVIKYWLVLYQRGDDRLIDEMIENLNHDGPTIGIRLSHPRKRTVIGDSAEEYTNVLKVFLDANPNLQLVVVVVRSSRDDIYRAIKRWSLLEYSRPICSQVLHRDTVHNICNREDFSLSVITQINCKMGGALWALEGFAENVCVAGISSHIAEDGREYIGFVSSKNQLFTQWYSFAMSNRKEQLAEQVATAVRKYTAKNNNKEPERFILFAHHINNFDETDVRLIRTAYGGKLTVLVLEDSSEAGTRAIELLEQGKGDEVKHEHKNQIHVPQKNDSPMDLIVCRVDVNDDKESFPTKQITKTVRQLKHAYYNVAGETCLPAPVLYAQRCAEFVGDTLQGEQSPKLGETLFYL